MVHVPPLLARSRRTGSQGCGRADSAYDTPRVPLSPFRSRALVSQSLGGRRFRSARKALPYSKWAPCFAEAVPDAGPFFVVRTLLAVGDVSERQAQLYHEGPRLQAASLRILESPGSRGKVPSDLQGFLNERIGVGEFLLGRPAGRSRYAVVGAQRARPDEVEVTFRICLFVVSFQNVDADRLGCFSSRCQAKRLPSLSRERLARYQSWPITLRA